MEQRWQGLVTVETVECAEALEKPQVLRFKIIFPSAKIILQINKGMLGNNQGRWPLELAETFMETLP